jgi:hypothetical protein
VEPVRHDSGWAVGVCVDHALGIRDLLGGVLILLKGASHGGSTLDRRDIDARSGRCDQ